MSPMSVMMLGADYDHHYAYETSQLGAVGDTLLTIPPTANIGTRQAKEMLTRINYYYKLGYGVNDSVAAAIKDYDASKAGKDATIANVGKTAEQIWNETSGLIKSGSLSNLALAIQGKSPGLTYEQALEIAKQGKSGAFDMSANMPIMLIGGVALVAVALMFATRKK